MTKTSSKSAPRATPGAADSKAETSAAEATQDAPSQATPPPAVSHRQDMPRMPTGLQGFSARSACVSIYGFAEKLGRNRDPGTIKTLVAQLERVSTKHLHPAVGSYKAEMLDYLRGLLQQAEA